MRTRRGRLGSLRGAGPRAVAVSLAVAAVAAMAWEPSGRPDGERTPPVARSAVERAPAPASASTSPPPRPSPRGDAVTVEAPVRIPDAAVVRLLRPGDRVDVLATAPPDGHSASAGADTPADRARIVARNVRVAAVPAPDDATGPSGEETGALVVLSVSRPTAVRLAGAAAHSRLAVTLC